VELTVLGTCGGFPGAGRAASGYLVRHDGFNLVVDLGNGALSTLQKEIGYHEIDAVMVSHSHPDHCVDLYSLFIARSYHPEPLPQLPLVAGEGVFERLLSLGGEEEELPQSFDVRRIEPGQSFELGPFGITSFPMPHWVPALGYRIQADGQTVAYTGDTGPTPQLEGLARDVDVLVAEATWLEGQGRGKDPYHLTAREAGEHAALAGTKRLVLSHFWPTNDRELSKEQAGEAFDPDAITLADEGLTLEVGR
jgi:ribonuclease BN (tRNA processing enzyme)